MLSPTVTQPFWGNAQSDAASAEGWDLFETWNAVQIERLIYPADHVPRYFASNEDAWRHVVAKAREGSELHLLALQCVSDQARERIRAACGDLP